MVSRSYALDDSFTETNDSTRDLVYWLVVGFLYSQKRLAGNELKTMQSSRSCHSDVIALHAQSWSRLQVFHCFFVLDFFDVQICSQGLIVLGSGILYIKVKAATRLSSEVFSTAHLSNVPP